MKTSAYKISIIGSGNMGGQLGRLWSKAGYSVFFSSRHPEKLANIPTEFPQAKVGTVEEAIAFGDIIVLAINYGTFASVIDQLAGQEKIIIDLTNPVYWTPNKTLAKAPLGSGSAGEELQIRLPKAKIVKAFSSHYAASLIEGHRDYPIAVFYTTDHPTLQATAEKLIEDIGFAPIYYGGLDRSVDIELYGKYSNKIMSKAEALAEMV